MISSYRLGDLVILENIGRQCENDILRDHPDSIGAMFIRVKRCGSYESKHKMYEINKLVQEYAQKHMDKLPSNIEESTVIHLRLGDVVAGNEWHEKLKRPLEISELEKKLEGDTNPRYVIGKCFFASLSSTNYEECIAASNRYLADVVGSLGATHFDSSNADTDLCCAVMAKQFIQGRGYFSKLIVDIRRYIGKSCVETRVD